MEFDTWLQANGFDPTAITEAQRKALSAAWRRDQNGDQGGTATATESLTQTADANVHLHVARQQQASSASTQTLDTVIAAARVEEDRKHKITELVAQVITEQPAMIEMAEALGRQAIEGKWPLDKFELTMLRERRPQGPYFAIKHEQPVNDAAIEAAVCRAGGLPDLEKHFDERTLDASHRHYRNGVGLADLVLTFAKRGGYRGISLKSGVQDALRAAFNPSGIQAAGGWGPSTGSTGLSAILSNTANKFLRAGFDSVDSAWREIASIRSVTDFKTITTYSLTGGLTYEKLPPGGEIKHGQLDGTTYTNQVDTYAKMIGIDRRDLVNDDLGALTGVSRKLGRGGALKLNDIFWAEFLNNSAFFAAGNNNVLTGAGSALALAGLEDADEKFRLQTDPDGAPLGSLARILLVPSALRITALNLMNSTTVVSTTTANLPLPDGNPFAGAYKVVSSPYMQNAAYTGYSAAAWYLLADPADLPVIEVAFLNGNQAPTVETVDADVSMLGIAIRGYHDFGANLQEFRGGVRSAGS